MAHEYELIEHGEIAGFYLFLVNMLYRTPHNHKDLELCLILRGEVEIRHIDGQFIAPENSFFLMNSFQPHELHAKEPTLILALQVSPDFFSGYFPQIEMLHFEVRPFSRSSSATAEDIFGKCLGLADAYFQAGSLYELQCASMVNNIFHELLQVVPYENLSAHQKQIFTARQQKFRFLTNAIDERYAEKLLLTDLAEELQVSVFYLSHFFKESFGMPFQEYLAKVRCEKARQMLLLTDRSLLDISMAAGFSDPKYFNRSFRDQYGMTPKEYRKNFNDAPLPIQQRSMLSTQEVLSREASTVLLGKYLSE